MSDCIFCKIIAGQIPAGFVRQDENLVAIRDINPAAPTHILIIPRRHLASASAAAPEDQALLGALLLAGAEIAREAGLDRGYRLVINAGPDGGQGVDHLHVHLLGGRALGWPPG